MIIFLYIQCLQFFFLSLYFFAQKSSYFQVFTSLYYHNKSGLRVSCNFYNNTKNSVQFHRSNNIVDGLHIQALVVCTLVVSNLLLMFLHELNKCNTKSQSKLHELDKDDVKQVFFVFCSGKTLLGIVSWFLFFFLCVILCVLYMM